MQTSSGATLLYKLVLQNCLGHGHGYECHSPVLDGGVVVGEALEEQLVAREVHLRAGRQHPREELRRLGPDIIYVCIYIYICVYGYVYIYIYIYT